MATLAALTCDSQLQQHTSPYFTIHRIRQLRVLENSGVCAHDDNEDMGLPKFWHTSCRDEMVVLCGGERKALGLDGHGVIPDASGADERGRKARLRERRKKGVTGGTDMEAREKK
jgi:hypothetical protein